MNTQAASFGSCHLFTSSDQKGIAYQTGLERSNFSWRQWSLFCGASPARVTCLELYGKNFFHVETGSFWTGRRPFVSGTSRCTILWARHRGVQGTQADDQAGLHSSYVTLISIIQAFPFLTLQLCTWWFDSLEPVGGREPSNRWWGWICHLHSRGCGWLLQVTPGLGVLVTEQNPLYPKLESAAGRLFFTVLS